MKKKKGFTLIELLAVIVVLAIIAIIATPLIINIIKTAKKGSAKASSYGMIEAARLYYTTNTLEGSYQGEIFTFEKNKKPHLLWFFRKII